MSSKYCVSIIIFPCMPFYTASNQTKPGQPFSKVHKIKEEGMQKYKIKMLFLKQGFYFLKDNCASKKFLV